LAWAEVAKMWRRGQAYSQDLRDRVLAAVDGGAAAGEVAALFKVSVSYISKAMIRRRATGERTARPQRSHQAFKLAPFEAAIRAEVLRRSDATLEELRRWLAETHQVEVSLGAMHNTLRRLGLTLKKSRGGPQSRIGPSSSVGERSGAASSGS
jgi:transposase